jgi:NO-binding membrane sensor protein with MHYT domain
MYRVLTCLTSEHDLRLVLVAGVICYLASLVAIKLFRRARSTGGVTRINWLIAAGLATGSGIWATHFIAMLAYDPGLGITYGLWLTVLSLMVAAVVTGLGLAVAVYYPAGSAVGGAIVGGGVACMHYLGIAAVELPGHIEWDWTLVATSIVVAMLFGIGAMVLARRRRSVTWTLAAALLLTLAIVSHHFIAMGAIQIIPDPLRSITALSLSPASLTTAIASVATAILCMSLAGASANRRFSEQNMQLTAALNNMRQGLLMFDASGRLVLFNQRYLLMYGISPESVKTGCNLADLLRLRQAVGTFKGDPDKYVAKVADEAGKFKGDPDANKFIKEGLEIKMMELPDGRTISIANQSIPGGGWVSTHQDVTEQRRHEQERDRMVAQEQRRSAVDAAIAAFRQHAETMLRTVGDNAVAMRSTASNLFAASRRTSERAEGAVTSSNEASVNVETAASAAEELSSSIGEISRQLAHTNDLVGVAVKEATTTNAEIRSLAKAAQKIGDVVKLIQDVAGQTNLLALNATIEAARAGEAGRGFAVVASEVKSLAVQTAKATEEIAGQIAGVQASTGAAVGAIGRIADRMQEISQFTAAAAASVHQQNAATGEISQNVASAADGTKEIVSVLSDVAGAATETRVSAETVLAASKAVETAAADLRTEVEGFLQKVAV